MATVPLNFQASETSQYVVRTPILDEGQKKEVIILVPAPLFDRVTDAALDVDGFTEDTKGVALRSWIGRFATNELFDHGITPSEGRSSWRAEVSGLAGIDEYRQLPFLREEGSLVDLRPITEDDALYEAEQRFGERVLAFLVEKGIIE